MVDGIFFFYSRLCKETSLSRNMSIFSLSYSSFKISLSLGKGMKGSYTSPTQSIVGSALGS